MQHPPPPTQDPPRAVGDPSPDSGEVLSNLFVQTPSTVTALSPTT